MRYSIDQLEAFVAAARNASFSKAARILGKAQSTVSLTIGNLELELGVKLFDRSTKYPQLTQEGRAVLAEAESVLFHCRLFEESSINLLRNVEASVNLALDATVPVDLLSSALLALAKEYPLVDINTVPPSDEGIAEMVNSGQADLGLTLVNYHYPEDISFYRLGQLLLVNVVHRDHPLARIETIRFSHLDATRQIAYAPNEQRVPTNQHMASRSVWSFQSYALILEVLRQGLGWAALPKWLADPYLDSGELVKLNLEAYPNTPWRVNVDVIWSKRRKIGAVAWWLRDYLARGKELSAFID